MNRSRTQFMIAMVGMVALAIITLVAVVGEVLFERGSPLSWLLVGAFTTATGQAIAYLFRLNGQSGG